MPGNSFGNIFRLITFGESHGPATGGIIDGCPSGLALDMDFIERELYRRSPRNIPGTTARKEKDEVQFLSGILDGKTLGTPLAFMIGNKDIRPEDYNALKDLYRPGHADHTYEAKYGLRDHRGGGRASGRETAARVVGGAVAKLFLKTLGIEIIAYTSKIGPVEITVRPENIDQDSAMNSETGCPDKQIDREMADLLEQLAKKGESAGGTVDCMIRRVPAGIGDPVFDKLSARLAAAEMSIGGTRGFEFGSGFRAAGMTGSEYNDHLEIRDSRVVSRLNLSGGMAGGISTGEDIFFRVAFKPPSSFTGMKRAIDREGNPGKVKNGRFDVCIAPRAIPVVEAMAALVLADHILLNRSAKIE